MSRTANKQKHTPVMQQFFRCKDQYPDAILFFRLGDFYEMFYDDAVVASELLDITLTSRSKTSEGEDIPMAGVPHHSASGYVARLLARGKKVAICEQMADPSTVKGVVPREVVRVVTPGLCLEPDALDARAHNYLAAVTAEPDSQPLGLAALELSTAELRACQMDDGAALLAELARLDPREILLPEPLDALRGGVESALPHAVVSPLDDPGSEAARELLARVLGADELTRAEGELSALGLRASAAALAYAERHQPHATTLVRRLGAYDPSSQLVLDDVAVRNLEIVRTSTGERRGSLLSLIDRTRSPMGARLLRRRLLAPLTDVSAIRRRHDVVEALVADAPLRESLLRELGGVGDLERLATRAEHRLATPRDLGGLRSGLHAVRELCAALARAGAPIADDPLARMVPDDPCADVLDMLATALVEEPPVSSTNGGIFCEGLRKDLDDVRRLSSSSKDVILDLERRERERTGIASLKIRYTKVFGYYLEVSKSKLDAVPDDYRRKQTVANAERFITEELEDLQRQILEADTRSKAIEAEMFADLRDRVAAAAPRVRALAARLADLDVHACFADVAHRWGYARPEVDEGVGLDLVEARHPIVERLAPAGDFVPNDVALEADGEHLMILTGPNMSGKSTAMRQVALAVILAQAGSFVPAARARIGIVDRIYTRVGATDNLGAGQSTFMVEMRETAALLAGATRRSLVVLDEIGRGTSTYDGLAIAWAVAEHLHDAIRCRTMFATHYHELCELAVSRPGVFNRNVAAREYGGDVVFLHKLVPGPANRSYGVAVAKLAGVPEIVLARARAILGDLEEGAPLPSGTPSRMRAVDDAGRAQLDLFAPEKTRPSEVERTLRQLDIDQLKPVDALVALSRLRDLLEAEEGGDSAVKTPPEEG